MGQNAQQMSASVPVSDDLEDPRQAFARVQQEIENVRARGGQVPENLKRLHRQLASECAALSQGR